MMRHLSQALTLHHTEPALNPCSPGSGRRPPALAGRDAELAAFRTIITRTAAGRGDRSIALPGLRGVGKTVLLNTFRSLADEVGWFTVDVEARSGSGAATRARPGRELLAVSRRLSRPGLAARIEAALPSATSSSATLGTSGVSFGLEAKPGRAASGNLEIDLEEMIADLCPGRCGV